MSWLRKIELTVRNRMPTLVRQPLRLAKLLLTAREGAREMPRELIEGCRVCASRFDLIHHMPKGGAIAEVGTYKGDFAAYILKTSDPFELHLIDLDFSRLNPAVSNSVRVRTHAGLSYDVLAKFPNEFFDWIYIDADHSYSGVLRDARASLSKVKRGGFLVFNDFAHMDPFLGVYGVHRGVVDFAIENNLPFVWLAYERHGLYDVALHVPFSV